MKKNVILYIDSSDNKKTIVGLEIDGKVKKESLVTDSWTSQVLLPLIDEVLKKNKIKIEDLNEIKVSEGPGSFTGIRVGITIANTLGWLFDIPVNGKKLKP